MTFVRLVNFVFFFRQFLFFVCGHLFVRDFTCRFFPSFSFFIKTNHRHVAFVLMFNVFRHFFFHTFAVCINIFCPFIVSSKLFMRFLLAHSFVYTYNYLLPGIFRSDVGVRISATSAALGGLWLRKVVHSIQKVRIKNNFNLGSRFYFRSYFRLAIPDVSNRAWASKAEGQAGGRVPRSRKISRGRPPQNTGCSLLNEIK